jgi:hypothetical protein
VSSLSPAKGRAGQRGLNKSVFVGGSRRGRPFLGRAAVHSIRTETESPSNAREVWNVHRALTLGHFSRPILGCGMRFYIEHPGLAGARSLPEFDPLLPRKACGGQDLRLVG